MRQLVCLKHYIHLIQRGQVSLSRLHRQAVARAGSLTRSHCCFYKIIGKKKCNDMPLLQGNDAPLLSSTQQAQISTHLFIGNGNYHLLGAYPAFLECMSLNNGIHQCPDPSACDATRQRVFWIYQQACPSPEPFQCWHVLVVAFSVPWDLTTTCGFQAQTAPFRPFLLLLP